jgi:hypothetical protein
MMPKGITRVLAAAVLWLAAPARAQCPAPGDCCAAHAGGGCADALCCAEVCAADAFCCLVEWDSLCAAAANGTCGACGAGCPGGGDCCAAHPTPGCNQVFCCELVCASSPWCCDTAWDAACAQQANAQCPGCTPPCGNGGDCCVPQPTPGCVDEACCDAVCAGDPFCCVSLWDNACAEQAMEICAGCAADCVAPELVEDLTFVAPPEASAGEVLVVTYRVENPGPCPFDLLLACVMTPVSAGPPVTSPACNSVVSIAAGAASAFVRCFVLPAAVAPGMYDVCYEIRDPGGVPLLDGFCRADLTVLSSGDLDGDGEVSQVDLFILLTDWGPCADCADCGSDLNRDCAVAIVDMLLLLLNWGRVN